MGHFEEPGVLDFGQFSHMNSPVRSVVPSTQTAVEAAPELEVMTPFARWFTIIPNFWWLAPVFGIRCERVPEALSGWKWCPYLFRCLVGLQPKSCASFDPKNGGTGLDCEVVKTISAQRLEPHGATLIYYGVLTSIVACFIPICSENDWKMAEIVCMMGIKTRTKSCLNIHHGIVYTYIQNIGFRGYQYNMGIQYDADTQWKKNNVQDSNGNSMFNGFKKNGMGCLFIGISSVMLQWPIHLMVSKVCEIEAQCMLTMYNVFFFQVCVCICMHLYIYIHTYICCIHICIYIYIYIYTSL